jgi:hypothetical protein
VIVFVVIVRADSSAPLLIGVMLNDGDDGDDLRSRMLCALIGCLTAVTVAVAVGILLVDRSIGRSAARMV